MNKYLPWIVIVLLGAAGYMIYTSPDAPEGNATLGAINESGISGTANLREEGGNVIVTLTVTGGDPNVPMPAHIHDGECPGVGAVRHALEPVVNGASVTSLAGITLSTLSAEMPLAINVHKSATEAAVYVACGSVNVM